jgi:hypothetical protein
MIIGNLFFTINVLNVRLNALLISFAESVGRKLNTLINQKTLSYMNLMENGAIQIDKERNCIILI